MSDINFAYTGIAGYLFLLNIASVFILGFIPGFYIPFLFFIKKKMNLIISLILAAIIGSIMSYFSAISALTLLSGITRSNTYLDWFLLPIIVLIEVAIVSLHLYSNRKTLKRKKNSKNPKSSK